MPIVRARTEYGEVRGTYAGNTRIGVFRGIPYAEADRWSDPKPPEKWEGVRDCLEYSAVPVQPPRQKGSMYQVLYFPVDLPMGEDCLAVNVWTPAESPDEKLPVAVWIYGGAYTSGYSNKIEFDGEAFAKRGCVFVSFNYRVGLLGFMAHPELTAESIHHSSGNYGLEDQIAALKWVSRNIASFGGDPENVTILGQSAGAMSCQNLCVTELTEGLFHRAVMESCAGMNPEFFRIQPTLEEAEETGRRALKNMGFGSIEEARSVSPEELMDRLQAAGMAGGVVFQPNVDGWILQENATCAVMRGHYKKIDYLFGSTANEGYGFLEGQEYKPGAFAEEARLYYEEEADDYLKAVGWTPDGTERPADQFCDNMLTGGTAWNEWELRRGGQTYYQYYFTKTLPGVESGAFHSAEHAYIFRTLDRFDLPYDGSDYELSKVMCDYWTNFVKTGDPNGEGLPVWKRYSEGPEKIMELGSEIRMIGNPDRPGSKFGTDYMVRLAEKMTE